MLLDNRRKRQSGGNGWGDPPVPIPNTAVKPPYVESTWLEAAWEDRKLPVEKTHHTIRYGVFFYMLELSIRADLGLGRMSRLALQGVRLSGSSVVRTPLMLLPENHTIRYGVFFYLRAFYPSRPWPGTHEPLAL